MQKQGPPIGGPVCYLAAAAVVVAAAATTVVIVAAAHAIVAAAAEQDQQDDDPAPVTATRTVIPHKITSKNVVERRRSHSML